MAVHREGAGSAVRSEAVDAGVLDHRPAAPAGHPAHEQGRKPRANIVGVHHDVVVVEPLCRRDRGRRRRHGFDRLALRRHSADGHRLLADAPVQRGARRGHLPSSTSAASGPNRDGAQLVLVAASLLPLGILVVAGPLGAQVKTAATVALVATVGLLAVFGGVAGRRGGHAPRGVALCAAGGGVLGVLIVIAKARPHRPGGRPRQLRRLPVRPRCHQAAQPAGSADLRVGDARRLEQRCRVLGSLLGDQEPAELLLGLSAVRACSEGVEGADSGAQLRLGEGRVVTACGGRRGRATGATGR